MITRTNIILDDDIVYVIFKHLFYKFPVTTRRPSFCRKELASKNFCNRSRATIALTCK